MDLYSWWVLRKISESCNENFEKDLIARLDYVKDETVDEDGDWATGFILADLIPKYVGTNLSLEEPNGSGNGLNSHPLYTVTEDPTKFHLKCNFCKKEVPKIDISLKANCTCYVCKACILSYMDIVFRHDIEGKKSIKSEGMHIGFICPVCLCENCVSLSEAQSFAPKAFKNWQDYKDGRLFQTQGFFMCPSCATEIKKSSTDSPLPMAAAQDINIVVSSANYIHCSNCHHEFSRPCIPSPYHQGKHYIESKEDKHATKCRYCESPISLTNLAAEVKDLSKSFRYLRHVFKKLGLDSFWCVNKEDFAGIFQFESSVCKAEECRKHMLQSCTRILDCGHHCGGISGEQICLPCLENKCQKGVMLQNKEMLHPSGDDICPICWTLSLGKAPSIQLRCGHIVHFQCAKNKLREGSSGHAITIDSLCCPKCSEVMHHESLASLLQRHFYLLDLVKEKAVEQLWIARLDRSSSPRDVEQYAMKCYRYYLCNVCQIPYCEGMNDPINNERNRNPHEPICGSCTAARSQDKTCKRGHGKRFIQYKCRYCCSAVIHPTKYSGVFMCDTCSLYGQEHHYVPSTECKGPECCPLGVVHGSHKREYCLGCSECRRLGQ